MDRIIRELLLGRFDFVKLSTSLVGNMPLVELQEDHNFVQIKALIQVVIEGCPKVLYRIASKIHPIAIAVVYKDRHTIQVVRLKTLFKELAEEACINR